MANLSNKTCWSNETIRSNNFKDEGILLFDANGDGNLDLYIASGGYKYEHNSANYQDRLYINDGKGNFTLAAECTAAKLYQ